MIDLDILHALAFFVDEFSIAEGNAPGYGDLARRKQGAVVELAIRDCSKDCIPDWLPGRSWLPGVGDSGTYLEIGDQGLNSTGKQNSWLVVLFDVDSTYNGTKC